MTSISFPSIYDPNKQITPDTGTVTVVTSTLGKGPGIGDTLAGGHLEARCEFIPPGQTETVQFMIELTRSDFNVCQKLNPGEARSHLECFHKRRPLPYQEKGPTHSVETSKIIELYQKVLGEEIDKKTCRYNLLAGLESRKEGVNCVTWLDAKLQSIGLQLPEGELRPASVVKALRKEDQVTRWRNEDQSSPRSSPNQWERTYTTREGTFPAFSDYAMAARERDEYRRYGNSDRGDSPGRSSPKGGKDDGPDNPDWAGWK